MIIFGWVVLLLITCYVTFGFIAANMLSLGFSGKSAGWVSNLLMLSLAITLWYFVFREFPFSVSIK